MNFEWKWKRLGDHCTKIGSGSTPTGGKDAYLESGPFTLIRSQNIYNDGFTPSGLAFINEDQAKKLNGVTVEKNDVLLNITGDSVARVCLALEKYLPSRVNQHVAIIRPSTQTFDSRYLRYFLASQYQQDLMLGLAAAGATRPALTKVMIEDFKIPSPPIEIQKEIADILSSLDDRITLLRETNTTLEAIAQALFKSWFVDFDPVHAKQQGRIPEVMDEATASLFPDSFEESELGLVPKGWRVGNVGDIGEVICGKTPPTSEPLNYGNDIPFITIPDMHNNLAVISTNKSLSTVGANTQKKKTLPPGSICVSCIATAGLVVRVTTPSQTNQQINSVIPMAKWGKSFPLFTLRLIGDAVRSGGSGGSIFHNLNKTDFEKLKVLFPDERIAMIFGDNVEPLVDKIIANQYQIETLTELRDTLLPRLISRSLRLPEVESS